MEGVTCRGREQDRGVCGLGFRRPVGKGAREGLLNRRPVHPGHRWLGREWEDRQPTKTPPPVLKRTPPPAPPRRKLGSAGTYRERKLRWRGRRARTARTWRGLRVGDGGEIAASAGWASVGPSARGARGALESASSSSGSSVAALFGREWEDRHFRGGVSPRSRKITNNAPAASTHRLAPSAGCPSKSLPIPIMAA